VSAARVVVRGVGKTYDAYASEWARARAWLGMPAVPRRRFEALADVDFELAEGESVGLIGGNGAGKSTLLRVIAGVTAPTSGRCVVRGTSAAVLELGLGFLPELTGRENVALAAGMLGLSGTAARAMVGPVREFAELAEAFDEPLRTYSTGMQARLAFAIATWRRPDLLVVDEVLSVGDAYFRAKSFRRIADYAAAGTSIIFVTHGLTEVGRLCDRAIWLEAGSVVLDGRAEDVTRAYADRSAARAAGPARVAA
jgi:lipopolysaccharide transport system ATP-binding protein